MTIGGECATIAGIDWTLENIEDDDFRLTPLLMIGEDAIILKLGAGNKRKMYFQIWKK